MDLTSILSNFRKFFPAQWINSLARQTGVVQRNTSKIEGKDLCQFLIESVNSGVELSLSSFCKKLYQNNRKIKLKIQSLWERIVNKKTVKFMEQIYERTWSIYVEQIKTTCRKHVKFFQEFTEILIEDSTVITLNEKLSAFFKGCGGSGGKSSLKIHLIFDAVTSKFTRLKISKDKLPDSAFSYDVIQFIKKRSLLIRDLGFFVIEAFKQIQEKGAYFLSRLSPTVNVYLKANDSNPIDLVKFIKTKYKKYSRGSLKVFLGAKEKFPVRLIFYRAPDDVINLRKRKVRRTRQKNGGTPSQKLLEWQEYTFFISNVSEEVLPIDLVGTVYRLRWDIELIFKTWKSHLRLNILRGTRKERIEVFLYAKLIGILLLGLISNHLKIMCSRLGYGVEISEVKVAKFLTNMNVLGAIFKGYLSSLITEFLNDLYWFKDYCKQKRRLRTTLERIIVQESYMYLSS